MEPAAMFEQEEPYVFLPNPFRITVTYETRDLDPGDPEVGPSPDVQTIPVAWCLMNGANYVVTAKLYGDHEWRDPLDRGWQAIQEAIRLAIPVKNTRAMVMGYLRQEGLI